MKQKDKRIYWIDNVRALALISMILYHGVWDLVYLFGMDWSWFDGAGAKIWQQSICWTFILLSGFCWSFSKDPLKQGILVNLCGFLVTLVTILFDYESRVIFGVLNLIGTSALLMILFCPIFEKIPAAFGAAGTFLLFMLTYGINYGFLGIFSIELWELPCQMYQNLLTAFLGFPRASFYSTDYFSILPWSFLYFTGYFLHRMWKSASPHIFGPLNYRVPLLTWIGGHSLFIYLTHQPVIYGVLTLIFNA